MTVGRGVLVLLSAGSFSRGPAVFCIIFPFAAGRNKQLDLNQNKHNNLQMQNGYNVHDRSILNLIHDTTYLSFPRFYLPDTLACKHISKAVSVLKDAVLSKLRISPLAEFLSINLLTYAFG